MPKLNSEVATKVENAEDGFKPVDEGIYTLQLVEDVDVKEGKKGPYWKWTFVIPEGMEHAGRKFFTNTSLSDAAYFKLKETFTAFGVPTNTDTEDLVGQKVKALITITTIQGGARSGELGNEISKLLPLDTPDEDVKVPAGAGAGVSTSKSAKDDEPLF
jgi:hypothetical protein